MMSCCNVLYHKYTLARYTTICPQTVANTTFDYACRSGEPWLTGAGNGKRCRRESARCNYDAQITAVGTRQSDVGGPAASIA